MNIFDILRNSDNSRKRYSAVVVNDEIFFRLSANSSGDYIVEAVNQKGDDWDHGYESLYGVEREAMKAFSHLQEINAGRFEWNSFSDHILLSEYDHLIPLLIKSGKFINADNTKLVLRKECGKIRLVIDDTGNLWETRLVLLTESGNVEKFKLLTETYALCGSNIISVEAVGNRFRELELFATQVKYDDLEKFLSLFYSVIDNVKVVLDNYKIVNGEERFVDPAVIFEEVDEDGVLKLRIAGSIHGFDPEFVDDYDIIRVASVNELERLIVVSDVIYKQHDECLKLISGSLRKLGRNNFYQDEEFFLIYPEVVEKFLAAVLPKLLAVFPCFGAEHLSRFKLRTSKPKLSVSSLSSGVDFLDTSVDIQFDDQSISLLEAIKHYKKKNYIALNDGSKAVVNPEFIKKLERIFRKQKDGVMRISFFDMPFLDDMLEQSDSRKIEGLESVKSIFKKLSSKKRLKKPDVNAELRPYQKKGYEWLQRLHSTKLCGCLADDMGLGKTLQALSLLQSNCNEQSKPSLIIMPRSLVFNWQEEISKFTDNLRTHVYYGSSRNLDEALQSQLILTTYGTVRSDITDLQNREFFYVILDESQNIKNPNAQISKAVQLLRSEHRLALSGTPVENNLIEVFSLFRFLNPSMFESLNQFNSDYNIPITKDNDKTAMRELQQKISPFILRRTKKEVLKDLPDKVEQTLYVDMSKEQAMLYESRRRYYQDVISGEISEKGINSCQFALLQAFTELRQIASTPESRSENKIYCPKREMIVQEVSEAVANGHKCLIFANFLGALDSLSNDFNEVDIEHLVMTGSTRDRESLVNKFQNDENVKVFLMTLKTGGVGLNLTAADYVFIYDPWWNRAAELQAIDRTHRIGQKNTVFTYKLVTRNTIEEKILKLQQMKKDIFDNLIGSDGASLKSLTEEDIRFALGVE